MEDFADAIRRQALEIGFDLCGIAPAISPITLPRLETWLDAGYAGEMGYLERRRAAYADPKAVLEVVRSILLLAVCYDPTRPESVGNVGDANAGDGAEASAEVLPDVGQVARYSRIPVDYHWTIRGMLQELAGFLHEAVPECRTRCAVDTAPLLERDFARQAGLGWFGKNTMLINKQRGSYFLLGAVLTDLELPPDAPHETSHCGTCTRCLDICPTDALLEPYVLDARRCISYLTIEQRQQPIDLELRTGMQDWMFGCDLCQEVCPWNRRAPRPSRAAFRATAETLSATELLAMDDATFKAQFRHTPLARPGRAAMARNAAIVLGNTRDRRFLPLLEERLSDQSPLVRGAAVWAIGEISGREAWERLAPYAAAEIDEIVRQEYAWVQQNCCG